MFEVRVYNGCCVGLHNSSVALNSLSVYTRTYTVGSQSLVFLPESRPVGSEPGSSVSIVSGYGLDDRAIKVQSPAEAKGFFL
jgi:hypothetical protein